MVKSADEVPVTGLKKVVPSSGRPNRNPGEGNPPPRSKYMFVPLLVQTNELRERPRSKFIPALPGRLTIGELQLKSRESRSSPDVPTRFSGANNAIGQFSSCVGGEAIDDEMFTAVIGAGLAATTFGMP